MTEGDLEVCAVIHMCEDGLLCEWKCNMDSKQLKRKLCSDQNSQNVFHFKLSRCPNAVEAFQNSNRYNRTVKY
jgi:hypothetical protein